jgi:hypothetical protein
MADTTGSSSASPVLTWLGALCLLLVGVGLVLPSSGPDPVPAKLIGRRTGDVLVIPTLKVRAPLVSVAMDAKNTLNPPRNPREVGWWKGGARPGSHTGQTLVTGHTVHTGGGALDKLGTVKRGALVRVVRTHDGTTKRITYEVTDVVSYSTAQVAQQADQLFGQTGGDGRLVLVTCTGWDGTRYHGNVVVLARPMGTTTTAA